LVGSGQSPQKAINIDKGQMGWLHVSHVMAQPHAGPIVLLTGNPKGSSAWWHRTIRRIVPA
jgi:hypothetical protein